MLQLCPRMAAGTDKIRGLHSICIWGPDRFVERYFNMSRTYMASLCDEIGVNYIRNRILGFYFTWGP